MELIEGGELVLRRAAVCASGLIYWGGVFLQARRVRKKIGRTPNLAPKDAKERLIWIGWIVVVTAWIGQPLLVSGPDVPPLQFIPALTHPATLLPGLGLILLGYAGTLWCYAAMGAAWRIGIDKGGASSLVQSGPYRRMRHPIYSFQMVMLLGAALLLPTPISLAILVLHFVFASIKASDEETHLGGVFGAEYAGYMNRTGRFAPKLGSTP
jgi:protein-S-isoprenylcysteine O-methyltransferase Ste14